VEYALLLGLFAAATTAGINVLNEESGAKVGDVATSVGDPPDVVGSIDPSTTLGGGGATTAPPTTAAPTTTTSTTTSTTTTSTTTTTTTTIAPTTTSTTTTVPVATEFGVNLSGANFTKGSGNSWSASVVATATDDLGQPVGGASTTVRLQIRRSNGNVLATFTLSGTTAANGQVTLSSSGSTSNRYSARFTVTSASASGLTWDGDGDTATDS
jgi:hypothetical protein